MENRKRRSIGIKLVVSFVVTSIIPIILINMFSYYNTSKIVKDNSDDLIQYNLAQTESSLDVYVESYEDILNQIYSDDDVIDLINKINQNEDLVLSKNQLRRALRGFFYAKKHIKSISVITENQTLVFYDSITGSMTRNSWMLNLNMDWQTMYDEIMKTKETYIIPTQKAETSVNEDNYLFHLGHRIVDYRKQNQKIGIVVLSIDEKMLDNICVGERQNLNAFNFIVDRNGSIVSHYDKSQLGVMIDSNGKDREEAYRQFIEEQRPFEGNAVSIHSIHDNKMDWEIVNVSNQNETLSRLKNQQKLMFSIMGISVLVLILVIGLLIRNLTASIRGVVKSMKSAESGEIGARVVINSKMPSEIETIANQYNATMDRLTDSIAKEKQLDEQKREAEITALEAQINPHFLYNMLDTINWIAIGRKEFEISRAITALAVILRYGINHSNGMVTIQEEYEWLKQYLLLQQTRLKDEFVSEVSIQPDAMSVKVHKLLMQPFIENAIIHGFEGVSRKHILKINIWLNMDNGLEIEIYDNGKGMPADMVENINHGIFPDTQERSHIGLRNAYSRIKLYYGEKAHVNLESIEHTFTKVHIMIPDRTKGDAEQL